MSTDRTTAPDATADNGRSLEDSSTLLRPPVYKNVRLSRLRPDAPDLATIESVDLSEQLNEQRVSSEATVAANDDLATAPEPTQPDALPCVHEYSEEVLRVRLHRIGHARI